MNCANSKVWPSSSNQGLSRSGLRLEKELEMRPGRAAEVTQSFVWVTLRRGGLGGQSPPA
jgi:hypothetical protein